jgi:hypothetical protein
MGHPVGYGWLREEQATATAKTEADPSLRSRMTMSKKVRRRMTVAKKKG